MKNIKIMDTTLRDGEQSPGCSMEKNEKLELALQLQRLGADIIEAGFPVSSNGDFESVLNISKQVKNSVVCALARTTRGDIDTAWEAISNAAFPRIHVFIATSAIHMEHKLKMTPAMVLERVEQSVRYARNYCEDIEFSAEDAGRSDLDFLASVYKTAIASGASVINVPDTVGYLTPNEITTRLNYLFSHVNGIDRVDVSVHNHNDLGLATANSLAAILCGVTQIECTVNGIGERAGNAALEEIVMAMKTRPEIYDARCNINASQIYRTSRLVSTVTGIPVPHNKAIVGQNAFSHEAGIHQHGVLQSSETYEIMTPATIGASQNAIVLGKHSGRHAFEEHLTALGYSLGAEQLGIAFEKFKNLTDRKKLVSDRDIEAIIANHNERLSVYELKDFTISSTESSAAASVSLCCEGRNIRGEACGTGPIDAGFTAINKIVNLDIELCDFTLRSITEGEDALGEAVVRMTLNGKTVTGRGVSTDVIEAGLKAYLNGVSRLI